MSEDRVQRAVEAHKNGCNCCQAVVSAFADRYGLSAEQAMRIAAAFGRGCGIGEMCGALSGALMLAGLSGGNVKDGKELIERFVRKAGAFKCKDLLAGPNPEPCREKVRLAAELFEEYSGR